MTLASSNIDRITFNLVRGVSVIGPLHLLEGDSACTFVFSFPIGDESDLNAGLYSLRPQQSIFDRRLQNNTQ